MSRVEDSPFISEYEVIDPSSVPFSSWVDPAEVNKWTMGLEGESDEMLIISGGNTSAGVKLSNVGSGINIVASEAIAAGDFVMINSEGKLVKATASQPPENSKPTNAERKAKYEADEEAGIF